jgi:hypothetical protein
MPFVVPYLVGASRDPLELVKVELALEGCEVAHPKVLGHDLHLELEGLVNHKGPAVGQERRNVSPSMCLEVC